MTHVIKWKMYTAFNVTGKMLIISTVIVKHQFNKL